MKYWIWLLVLCPVGGFTQVEITQLLLENRVNPIGIEEGKPRFTWVMSSLSRNKSQSAYQLRVATSVENLTSASLLWDSGKQISGQSVLVPYTGPLLASGQRYFWQVRVWDEQGQVSGWSAIAFWQMGLLDPENEFTARWIMADFEGRESPIFRKQFTLSRKKIKRATAYITAHGLYEAWLNGQRIGDAYLSPGWTSYNKRLQYQVYDVTDLLQSGENVWGAMLGSGWYRGNLAWKTRKNIYGKDVALLCQLEVLYEDGTVERIGSDESWTCAKGPVTYAEIYHGEVYNSLKEPQNWKTKEFQGNWEAVKVADFPKSNLIATYNEPIRKQEILEPIAIFTSPKGELIADFGQNLVGWVQFHASGNKADSIHLYHAEVLDKEGNFYTDNLREAKQKVTYILDGTQQVLEPHFTFQGFRYVKIEGVKELKKEDLKAIALYSDMEPVGRFTCSDSLLNQLQSNIQWGQRGNFVDVPTDCPQRDERMGWTGDAQVFFRTAAFNYNVHSFFAKWMQDLSADQRADGAVPWVVPHVMGTNAFASAGWSDAATIIPWQAYQLYGDKRMLERQYPSMKAWVEYMRAQSEDHLWRSGRHFGDWLFYSPNDDRDGKAAITDKDYITQCFYAYSTGLLAQSASVLGYEEDAVEYETLLEKVKQAFLHEFMSSSGRLGPNTQTAYVLALQFDLLPDTLRAQAAQRLVENIKSYNYHLTTGFLGTPYLCHVLSRFGHEKTAFELLRQTTYPSWLYPVKMGATTIWERWDGIKPDSTFQDASMNSFNHYAYGAIGDWMYQNVAGIQEKAPGYKEIIIRPIPGGGIRYAEGTLHTYYGTIRSSWREEPEAWHLEVEIPVNTTAEIYLPASEGNRLNVKKVGSGKYQFRIEKKKPNTTTRLREYTGIYNIPRGFGKPIKVELVGEELVLIMNGQREKLKEKAKDVFSFVSHPDHEVEFKRSRAAYIRSIWIKRERVIGAVKE